MNSPISSNEASEVSTPNTEPDVLFEDQNFELDAGGYILVTGGLGYIGSHTSLELLKTGHNIIIVDDLSNSFEDVFERILLIAKRYFTTVGGQCPQAKFYNIDYRDQQAMENLLSSYTRGSQSSITGVIHFAAYKAVEESIHSPLKYYRNNINGLVDFLSLLEIYDIKNFVFSSSATVYGTLADQGIPLREEDCVHQSQTYHDSKGRVKLAQQGCTGLTNPYGRTKFFGEAILSDLAKSDPSWTILALRYFNPIGCDSSGLLGEDPRGVPSNLLPVVVKVMTGQWKELSVFGSDWDTADGTAIRDFIHVTDLARGHIAALSSAKRFRGSFRTFNLGTGQGNSVASIVSTMEAVSQKPIPRRIVGRREGDVGSCVAVADRAAQELDWQTEKTLHDACQDICNFLKLNGTL